MGIISRLHQKRLITKISNDLGPLLVQVSVHECGNLQRAWNRQFDDEGQAALFAEFSIILIAVADRLASETFGDPARADMMRSTFETISSCFANLNQFGESRQDRVEFFGRLFDERFQELSVCSSIMGKEQDSVCFSGARRLVENFLVDVPESRLVESLVQTAKLMGRTVIALQATEPFKALIGE